MLKRTKVSEVLAAESNRLGRRRLVLLAVVGGAVLIAAGAGWYWLSGGFAPATPEFVAEPLQRGDIRATLIATGTIEPAHQVGVVSADSGTIDRVYVDFNQAVQKGEILAQLDLGDVDARLRRAMALVDVQSANRSVAEASLSDAEAALQRGTALSGSATISPKDLELAKSAVQRADAGLDAARAQLRAAEADLVAAQNDYDDATIRSPIDGVVLAVDVEPGQSIGTASLGTALFTIASDLTVLDLEAEIDEADIDLIAQGDRATFTVEAMPDQSFDGVVRQVRLAPIVRDGVVNYTAIIGVDNAALLLMPGMTATAEIVVDEVTDVLVVPNAALRFTPPGTSQVGAEIGDHLYLLDGKQARQVSVTVGLTDGLRTEITGGDVAPGDVVITGAGGV